MMGYAIGEVVDLYAGEVVGVCFHDRLLSRPRSFLARRVYASVTYHQRGSSSNVVHERAAKHQ